MARYNLRTVLFDLEPLQKRIVKDLLKAVESNETISKKKFDEILRSTTGDHNYTEFATILGLHKRTIPDWVKQGCPVNDNNRLNFRTWFKWYRDTKVQINKPKPQTVKFETENLRKVKAQADLHQIKILQLEQKLVERGAATRFLELYISTTCAILDDLPKKMISFIPKELRNKVAEMAEKTLAEIKKECSRIEI